MLKIDGTEEIGLVTPTLGLWCPMGFTLDLVGPCSKTPGEIGSGDTLSCIITRPIFHKALTTDTL